MLLSMVTLSARAEDFWGRALSDQPTDFVFGYGSLINETSRNATSVHPIAAIPVRVSAEFGYIRAWNERSPSGFTGLGLRKPMPGESATTINGVLYPVHGNDMAEFDDREHEYMRVEVPRATIEAVSWQALPALARVWVYVPIIASNDSGTGLQPADARFPLLESYIDVVVEGGLEYGTEFAREILVTTRDWSCYWLNDRDLGRRPWVVDKQSAAVDKLLSKYAPHFTDRTFPEEFTAKHLLGTDAHCSAEN
jgi:hypothetical protein